MLGGHPYVHHDVINSHGTQSLLGKVKNIFRFREKAQ